MKVYSAMICIDCRNFKQIRESRKLDVEVVDIVESTANLREFLALRDKSDVFDGCRDHGGIGIPCFVEGDKVTLDIDEAMGWLGQPPIREDEIIEHRT